MIDIDLRSYILSKSSLTASLGDRVYPIRLPQATTETSLTYQISGVPEVQVGSVHSVTRHELTLNLYSPSYAALRNVSKLLTNELNGYAGPMGNSTITGCYTTSTFNTFEEEPLLYREVLTFNIHTN